MSNTTPILSDFERGRKNKHGNPDFVGMVETRHLIVGRALPLLERAARITNLAVVKEVEAEVDQNRVASLPERVSQKPLQGVLTQAVEAPPMPVTDESSSAEKDAMVTAARFAVEDVHNGSDDVDLSGLPGYGDDRDEYTESKYVA